MYTGQFVIMSATTDANRGTHDEYHAWQELTDLLDSSGLFYTEVEGCYKGEKERAIIVQLHGIAKLPVFLQWAKAFEQESILWVDNEQNAVLLYAHPYRSQGIGKWKETDECGAKQQNAWTKVGDCYYICE